MYANIVIGVDGKDGGRDAIALAPLLARDTAEIAVLHVSPAESRRIAEADRKLLGRPADALWIDASSVGAGVEDVAEHRGADLVVIGSAHHGAVGRVLAGDDAASVLHHAHRSVALAPHGFRDEAHRLETVGVAYDGSPESRVALRCAEELAQELGAQLRARAIAEPYPAPMRVGPSGAYADRSQRPDRSHPRAAGLAGEGRARDRRRSDRLGLGRFQRGARPARVRIAPRWPAEARHARQHERLSGASRRVPIDRHSRSRPEAADAGLSPCGAGRPRVG